MPARRCEVDMGATQKHYTIGQLSKLAGVSARALRHYEDLGLLEPARTASGYRVYRPSDAKRLAQILSMKACGLPLMMVRHLLDGSETDVHAALVSHLATLRAQGDSLHEAIARTEAAIAVIERISDMNEADAFESLKQQELKDFEETYGEEARQRYGSDVIDAANERMKALSRDEWDAKELLEESIKVQLRLAMASGDPAGEESAELVRMHARWIRIHWGEGYSREAHLGLAHGYLADQRFIDYYDGSCGQGATEFLVRTLEANL